MLLLSVCCRCGYPWIISCVYDRHADAVVWCFRQLPLPRLTSHSFSGFALDSDLALKSLTLRALDSGITRFRPPTFDAWLRPCIVKSYCLMHHIMQGHFSVICLTSNQHKLLIIRNTFNLTNARTKFIFSREVFIDDDDIGELLVDLKEDDDVGKLLVDLKEDVDVGELPVDFKEDDDRMTPEKSWLTSKKTTTPENVWLAWRKTMTTSGNFWLTSEKGWCRRTPGWLEGRRWRRRTPGWLQRRRWRQRSPGCLQRRWWRRRTSW